MSGELSILIVEDQALDAELLEHELHRIGIRFRSFRVYTRSTLEAALREFQPDLILSDFSMPSDLDGFSALEIARSRTPDVPFIFVSGTIGEERAVDAMKAGATDYVLKDRLERLGPVVDRALQEARHRREAERAQAALRESESRFRSFMRHLPGSASIRDSDGRYRYVNEVWQETFGKRAEDVLGRSYDEVWDAQSAADLKAQHRTVLDSQQMVRRVVQHGDDEDARWWLVHHFPISGDGAPAMVGSIDICVTDQKRQEERLARLSRIHAVLSGINAAVIRLRDEKGLLEEACRIAVEDGGFGMAWIGLWDADAQVLAPMASAGLPQGEDLRTSPLVLNGAPPPGGRIDDVLRRATPVVCNDLASAVFGDRGAEALRRGYRSVVVLPLEVSGRVRGILSLYATEAHSFKDDELRLLDQLAADVSFALEHMEKERELYHLAWHDPVTGAGNRGLLHERLQFAIDNARSSNSPIAVLVWDVKRFREINDSFGRSAGDELLRDLVRRVADGWPEVREVARLSSDYFGGFTTEAKQPSDIAHLLERSSPALSRPFTIDGVEIVVGITVGIAFFPADAASAEGLLANAEAALKQAKSRGERYLFYEPAMNARVAEKLALESKLRRALEREQFELHYQRKVSLKTGAIEGLEALIRWNDPEAGLVPPAHFIALLEETGLILEVGRWAICKALEDRTARARQGIATPPVAVNVSALQLRRPELVDVIAAEIERSGLALHGLDLEITESLLMHDIENSSRKLHALKEMGVRIAIDDFGTGYSSLAYLATLPVDALKIDRSFISTMEDKPESMTIVSSVISLAHTLRLSVIAEGVEREEQAKLLRLLNCDQAQGYLFARPARWGECFD